MDKKWNQIDRRAVAVTKKEMHVSKHSYTSFFTDPGDVFRPAKPKYHGELGISC